MLEVTVEGNGVRIGAHFTITFQRTLRLPDDGGTYPLPPSLGQFPVHRVEDYLDRVPEDWRERRGVFIPMYQREAMWLNFIGDSWHPVAAKVGIGKVNALTGKGWDTKLHAHPQDYLVCPNQPWLDGINAGNDYIRQFVAMPLGRGYTVEGQVTGEEVFGGLQIIVFDAKPGRFPEESPAPPDGPLQAGMEGMAAGKMLTMAAMPSPGMGLAAGGKMKQAIYPDPHGIDTWDQGNNGEIFVHIVNSELYREITGLEPPPTPVDAHAYTEHGYPWFALYDEQKGDIAPSDVLAGVKSVKEFDQEQGLPARQDDSTVEVPEQQIRKIRPGRRKIVPKDAEGGA
jgi:hypothetical protein